MLELKLIRDNPDLVRAGLIAKKSTASVDEVLALDQQRRELLHQAEQLKGERNKATAEIARKKKAGENADVEVSAMREVGDQIAALDERVRVIEADLEEKLSWFPNLPHESVPRGMDESANVVLREWGDIPKPSFAVLPHWEIGERLGVLDLQAATKISGAGFYVLKGNGARLQRALISYMLDLHREAGFIEVNVPHVVTPNTMFGTGQLPKLAEDMYHLAEDDLYLIPTAEVPVTNLYKQEILTAEQLPIYHACYTPCFRREAGAAGKDTRGMIRVHQFDKVELVKIVQPENSYEELESLVRQAEKVLHGLKLPYRVLSLCTGDLSFAAAKCYDLELWCAGIEKYLEISSCSNFEDFQSRRMKCRVRDKQKEIRFPHTLNGSALALARLIPAILENYQQPDGTVTIPEVLRPYLGGLDRLS